MNAHNTFEQPDVVKPESFHQVEIKHNTLAVQLPPMSVITLAIAEN